jgi:hypothetical protein
MLFVFASIADPFINFFGNVFSDIFLVTFLLIGVLLGIFLRPFFGNQVIKLYPDECRFQDYDIKEETAISLRCKKEKGMPEQKFFKFHPGFTGIRGKIIKKPVTVFLARVGTAFTSRIEGDKNIDVGTLANGVKVCCGEEFFNEIPDEQKEQLEESKISVTIGLQKDPLTPEGFKPISEENLKAESDREAAQTLWEGKRKQKQTQYINLILAGGTGAAIMAVAFLLGIIKTPVVIVHTGGNGTTTSFILSLFGIVI